MNASKIYQITKTVFALALIVFLFTKCTQDPVTKKSVNLPEKTITQDSQTNKAYEAGKKLGKEFKETSETAKEAWKGFSEETNADEKIKSIKEATKNAVEKAKESKIFKKLESNVF